MHCQPLRLVNVACLADIGKPQLSLPAPPAEQAKAKQKKRNRGKGKNNAAASQTGALPLLPKGPAKKKQRSKGYYFQAKQGKHPSDSAAAKRGTHKKDTGSTAPSQPSEAAPAERYEPPFRLTDTHYNPTMPSCVLSATPGYLLSSTLAYSPRSSLLYPSDISKPASYPWI